MALLLLIILFVSVAKGVLAVGWLLFTSLAVSSYCLIEMCSKEKNLLI